MSPLFATAVASLGSRKGKPVLTDAVVAERLILEAAEPTSDA